MQHKHRNGTPETAGHLSQCHQYRNQLLPGQKHPRAQGGLGSAPGTDSCGLSIQAKWRVVRGMRRLQSAGAEVFAVWPFPSGQGVALLSQWPLAVPALTLQGPPCWASPSCHLWPRGDSSVTDPSPCSPGVSMDTREPWTGLVPVALSFSDIVALSCCVPYPSLLALCFTKWGTRCFQFPLTKTLPQLWAGSWIVRLNLFQ